MNKEKKIQALRMLLGDFADRFIDESLELFLDMAEIAIMDWRFGMDYDADREMPMRYDMHQVRIAQFLIQRQGAEGETSHSENGVSRTYGNSDIPYEYFNGIVPVAGVIR